jgi:hypothetical protein
MNHATSALMLRGIVDTLREPLRRPRTPRVERMQHRGGGIAIAVNPHHAMPERVHRDGHGLDVFPAHLPADVADGPPRQRRQFVRIDFPAPVSRGVGAVLGLGSEALDLAAIEREEQRAGRGTSHIQGQYAIHLSVVACQGTIKA